MSLINDALKRAKQAQQKNPPPPDAGLQFRPVEPGRDRNERPGTLMPVVLTVMVAVTAILLWQAFRTRDSIQQSPNVANTSPALQPEAIGPAPASKPAASAPTTASPPAPAAQPIAEGKPAAITASATPQASVAQTANTASPPVSAAGETTSTNNAPVAVNEPAPPKPAPLKLQGIFYRPDRPAAVISGKTLFIGDRVGEFRVVAISQASVTVAGAGQTNVLSLEQ